MKVEGAFIWIDDNDEGTMGVYATTMVAVKVNSVNEPIPVFEVGHGKDYDLQHLPFWKSMDRKDLFDLSGSLWDSVYWMPLGEYIEVLTNLLNPSGDHWIDEARSASLEMAKKAMSNPEMVKKVFMNCG